MSNAGPLRVSYVISAEGSFSRVGLVYHFLAEESQGQFPDLLKAAVEESGVFRGVRFGIDSCKQLEFDFMMLTIYAQGESLAVVAHIEKHLQPALKKARQKVAAIAAS